MASRKGAAAAAAGSGSGGESSRVDTRYYDELFVKIRESDEFVNDPESLEILYENIIEQISKDDKELVKCLHSFHIDYFVYKSNLQSYAKIFDLLTQSEEKIQTCLNDSRMSRVYDAVLLLCGDKIKSASGDDSEKKVNECMHRLADYFVQNFVSLVDNQTGVFALRSFLRVVGERDALDEQNVSNKSAQQNNNNKRKFINKNENEFSIKNIQPKPVPKEWKLEKYLKKLAKALSDFNILEKGLVPSVSPTIGLLLRKLRHSCAQMCTEIVQVVHRQYVKKPNSFQAMIQDAIGSRFVESFLFVCDADLLIDHYLTSLLLPNLISYANHVYANYPIQTLLKHRIESEPRLSILFDSLVENLGSIVNLHTDLSFKNYFILEMLNACQKCSSLDLKKLMNTLIDYFGCNEDEKRIHFLKVLLVYEKVEDIEKECSIDQALLFFDLKPIASTIATKLIELDDKTTTKSFNSLNANEIEFLCTNNVGSHFIQQCLKLFDAKDRTVAIQSFMDKLRGRCSILCTNKSGSFVIETIWSVSNLKQRLAIVDELKSSENQLKNDQVIQMQISERFARFFVNKIGLSFYKRKPDEWKQIQTNEFKKKRMLSELLDENDKNESSNSTKNVKKQF